ncbi:phage head closure protein [Clostridium chrysemydis]|uniref:phage head closure protein n=1 Tax=Clostridium chrysemydis TaxID=2665504 RepID=UPI003F41129A
MYKDFNKKQKELLEVFDRKITIYIREDTYVDGRKDEETKVLFDNIYVKVQDMYSDEFYQASHAGYKDTLIFKTRYFPKLEVFRDDNIRKKVLIEFEKKTYELIRPDYLNDNKEVILLKVNRVS